MAPRSWICVPLSLLFAASTVTAQDRTAPTADHSGKPAPRWDDWKWWQKEKDVTGKFPTEYVVGAVYRLKKDVVVECGQTASGVSPYWVDKFADVETVELWLRDPQAARDREIATLRRFAADSPLLASGMEFDIWRIRHRHETRSVLYKGTLLRFRQIWVRRNFELGTTVQPYVEVLAGPLRGKWVDLSLLSKSSFCDVPCSPDPEWLEYVGK